MIDQSKLRQAFQQFGQELSAQLNKRLEADERARKAELDKVVERINTVEEQLQGVIGYLGIQAGRNDWQDIDLAGDATHIIKKKSLKLSHKPSATIGSSGLAHWAGFAILAVQDIRREVQKLSREEGGESA